MFFDSQHFYVYQLCSSSWPYELVELFWSLCCPLVLQYKTPIGAMFTLHVLILFFLFIMFCYLLFTVFYLFFYFWWLSFCSYLEIYSEGWLRTKLYDKGDDFNFSIVNFPFIYIVTFLQHLHIDNEILKLVLPIIISLMESCC